METIIAQPDLAHILMGEAGTCGMVGLLAVAWVYSRNKHMNGYSSYTSVQADFIARFWYRFPDVTNGRKFVFSESDMRLPAVQRLIKIEGRSPPVVVECQKGLRLYVW